jgi:hypothetical protein
MNDAITGTEIVIDGGTVRQSHLCRGATGPTGLTVNVQDQAGKLCPQKSLFCQRSRHSRSALDVHPRCTWDQTQKSAISTNLEIAFILLEKSGAPGGTRTPDLLVRSQTLYPTELRAHCVRRNINIGEVCAASEVGRRREKEGERKTEKERGISRVARNDGANGWTRGSGEQRRRGVA